MNQPSEELIRQAARMAAATADTFRSLADAMAELADRQDDLARMMQATSAALTPTPAATDDEPLADVIDINEPTTQQVIDARRRLPDPDERRAIRTAAGLSCSDVARHLGVTRQAVSKWERRTGIRLPENRNVLVAYVALLDRLRDAS